MIPERHQIAVEDTWNLDSLYVTPEAWNEDLALLGSFEERLSAFKGRLAESAETLADFLELHVECGMVEERLGYYAMLRQSEDAGDSSNQERYGRFIQTAARLEAATSFFAPELMAIPESALERWMVTPRLEPFRIVIDKVVRFRAHTLNASEERLLALQTESSQTASRTFRALLDVDLDFGEVDTPEGPRPLTQSTLSSLLEHRDRDVRERSFTQFYDHLEHHKNSLASLYAGSVQQDVYRSRVRAYPSSLEMNLYPDDVPVSLYDALVGTVRSNLSLLHRYYKLRGRVLQIDPIAVFDMRVPLVPEVSVDIPFEKSVEMVIDALHPLGGEYTATLRDGLLGGWVDRYENKGKRSGAFSAGSYVGDPYILMNYKRDTLRDTFTLAHEGGHSMHSWYSVRNNPFQNYDYTIFEAEVASTFNEQLLLHNLLAGNADENMRNYLLNKSLDDLIGTLFRQTMFAEFERRAHEIVEGGDVLTVDRLRSEYRELLSAYFGSDVSISAVTDLEGLRIPHFYRAFYVYKYATGIAAAISLSRGVLSGGEKERQRYFAFLKSGGSRYPLESLRAAGVDLTTSQPFDDAMALFGERLAELERSVAV